MHHETDVDPALPSSVVALDLPWLVNLPWKLALRARSIVFLQAPQGLPPGICCRSLAGTGLEVAVDPTLGAQALAVFSTYGSHRHVQLQLFQ